MNDLLKTIKHFNTLQKRYTTQHKGEMCERVADALEALEYYAEATHELEASDTDTYWWDKWDYPTYEDYLIAFPDAPAEKYFENANIFVSSSPIELIDIDD